MKKIVSLLIAVVLVMGCYAAPKQQSNAIAETITNTSKDVKEAVSTVHNDTKEVVSTVYQDSKEAVSTLYKDSKNLAIDLYPDVKSAVMEIAKAIGVAAEHLYTVLVKKYVVEGLVQTIPFIIGLVLLIIGWVKLEKYFKISGPMPWHIIYPLALTIAGIICLCATDYNTMFMGLVNPEFGAINYILDFTKDMVK